MRVATLSEESLRSSRCVGTTNRKSLPNAFGIPTNFISNKSRDEDIPSEESDTTNDRNAWTDGGSAGSIFT